MMRTTYMAKGQDIDRKWYVIDAEGKTIGRMATEVATILRGKHKPIYTPHVDTGDHVIIVNAGKVHFTGNKLNDKKYYNHSGYPGGMRERTAGEMRDKYPRELLERTIKGMLPHNSLGRQMAKKLHVYGESVHPHEAQQPVNYELKG